MKLKFLFGRMGGMISSKVKNWTWLYIFTDFSTMTKVFVIYCFAIRESLKRKTEILKNLVCINSHFQNYIIKFFWAQDKQKTCRDNYGKQLIRLNSLDISGSCIIDGSEDTYNFTKVVIN